MLTHRDIDRRLLALVILCVRKIDADPSLWTGRVAAAVRRLPNARLRGQWEELLGREWSEVRGHLLEEGDAGDALRQSAPLGGLLTNAERRACFPR